MGILIWIVVFCGIGADLRLSGVTGRRPRCTFANFKFKQSICRHFILLRLILKEQFERHGQNFCLKPSKSELTLSSEREKKQQC